MHADTAVPFDDRVAWLAVADRSPLAVAEALGLRDVRPTRWRRGVELAYRGDHVFVAPPVLGWTLVPGIDATTCADRLAEWSGRLGEVQLFTPWRTAARAVDGVVLAEVSEMDTALPRRWSVHPATIGGTPTENIGLIGTLLG